MFSPFVVSYGKFFASIEILSVHENKDEIRQLDKKFFFESKFEHLY